MDEVGAVVLLSGGLDSIVNLAIEARRRRPVLAITFDYGQRCARQEVRAATRAASFHQAPHRVVKLPWLAEITRTALVDGAQALPHPNADDLDDTGPGGAARQSAAAVWVPNRNGVFLNVAAAYAEHLGSRRLVTGFNAEEAATFPDNTPEFARAVTRCLAYSTANAVEVVCHTGEWGKERIVRHGLELAAHLEVVWSCYEGGGAHCGRCESCMRARRAFTAVAVPDALWPAGLRAL